MTNSSMRSEPALGTLTQNTLRARSYRRLNKPAQSRHTVPTLGNTPRRPDSQMKTFPINTRGGLITRSFTAFITLRQCLTRSTAGLNAPSTSIGCPSNYAKSDPAHVTWLWKKPVAELLNPNPRFKALCQKLAPSPTINLALPAPWILTEQNARKCVASVD